MAEVKIKGGTVIGVWDEPKTPKKDEEPKKKTK